MFKADGTVGAQHGDPPRVGGRGGNYRLGTLREHHRRGAGDPQSAPLVIVWSLVIVQVLQEIRGPKNG